jgi:hypothetical protein
MYQKLLVLPMFHMVPNLGARGQPTTFKVWLSGSTSLSSGLSITSAFITAEYLSAVATGGRLMTGGAAVAAKEFKTIDIYNRCRAFRFHINWTISNILVMAKNLTLLPIISTCEDAVNFVSSTR